MFRLDLRSGGEEGGHCSSGVSFFRELGTVESAIVDEM